MTQLPNGKYNWPVNPTEDLKEFPVPYYASDRWEGIRRDYDWTEVERLRGSVCVRHTLAEMAQKNSGTICTVMTLLLRLVLIPVVRLSSMSELE